MNVVERELGVLVGKPCWGVRTSYAEILNFSFGKPRLEIHEPRKSESPSPKVRRLFALRRIAVRGEWNFHTWMSNWKIGFPDGRVLTADSSPRSKDRRLGELQGQALLSCSVDRRSGRTQMQF